MQTIDTLIHARWIIPVIPENTVLEDHSLAIRAGRIEAILPKNEAEAKYQANSTHVLEAHALIPGLINTHTHAAMTLMRGLADDMPLMQWLNEHIWPTEQALVGADFVNDGTRLAMAEMLRGGITCFSDMYFFPDEVAHTASNAGMRTCVGLIVIDFPTVWASDAQEYLSRGIQVHDHYRNDPLVRTAFAPHAPYTVSDEPLRKIRVMSEELDIPIHIHLHETSHEIEQGIENYGHRPIARLAGLGLVNSRLIAAHMCHVTDEEIQLFADSGAHVVHCPESNLKLASGLCQLKGLTDAGVNVALGTDGTASNNDLNMFGEMRTAALLAKGLSGDPRAIPAATALSMATINAARALGIEDETGSLTPGKAADITAIDLSAIETQPVYDPVSHMVYVADRQNVTDVWVAGRHLLNDRSLTSLDENELLEKAHYWQQRINALNSGK